MCNGGVARTRTVHVQLLVELLNLAHPQVAHHRRGRGLHVRVAPPFLDHDFADDDGVQERWGHRRLRGLQAQGRLQ
jgi:hypothetical protein